MINLDSPQCFTGECYAEDIPNYPDATIDPDSRGAINNLGEKKKKKKIHA